MAHRFSAVIKVFFSLKSSVSTALMVFLFFIGPYFISVNIMAQMPTSPIFSFYGGGKKTAWGIPFTDVTSSCFDRSVNTVLPLNKDRVMVAGDFIFAGQCSDEKNYILDLVSGTVQTSLSASITNGKVTNVIPDQAGGWYIAGDFTSVAGVARNRVARVNSSGVLDFTFNPSIQLNNSIKAIEYDPVLSRLYLAGSFVDNTAPAYGTSLNATTGKIDYSRNLLSSGLFNADVLVSEPDGAGGWYLGGTFSSYQGQSLGQLIHVNADGSVDTTFTPQVSGSVKSLLLDGNNLWLGGTFTHVGGVDQPYFAAVDASTGVRRSINRKLNGEVTSLAKLNDKIVFAGLFTAVDFSNEVKGMFVTNSTGNVSPNDFSINGKVCVIVPDGSGGWYIGGEFTKINGVDRKYIARLNSDGSLNSWYPAGGSNGSVFAIAVNYSNNVVYLGGAFSNIGGQSRNYIAAVNSAGSVLSWLSSGANYQVYGLDVNQTTGYVYAAGFFTWIGSQSRRYVAEIKDDGTVTSWNPSTGSTNGFLGVVKVNQTTQNIFIGGSFTNLGGRHNLAEITSAGTTTSFSSIISYNGYDKGPAVRALAIDESTGNIFIGGSLQSVGGQTRKSLAQVTSMGVVTSWYPSGGADDSVSSLYYDSSSQDLYVGGRFASIGGQNRNLMAIVASSGVVTSWQTNPTIVPYGEALVSKSSNSDNILVVGSFNAVDGQLRSRLAAVDKDSGVLTSWTAPISSWSCNQSSFDCGDYIGSLITLLPHQSAGKIYVGGRFAKIGIASRYNLAALDASANVTPFIVYVNNNGVNALALDPISEDLFIGGSFSQVNSTNRNNIARVTSGGVLANWYPSNGVNGEIYSFALDALNSEIFVGGNFGSVGGQTKLRIAKISTGGTANVSNWGIKINGVNASVNGVKFDSATNKIYINGSFRAADWIADKIVALSSLTGAVVDLQWPYFDSDINALALNPSTNSLFLGGSFTVVAANTRNRIAEVASSGVLTNWYPSNGANGVVNTLALDGAQSALYVGGAFFQIGGSSKYYIAKVNSNTGSLFSWCSSGAGASVNSVKINSITKSVYAGGSFTSLCGQSRNRLGEITSAGVVTSWYPESGAENTVKFIDHDAITGDVYVSGDFDIISNKARSRIAKINSAGSLTDWAQFGVLSVNAPVLAFQNTGAYVGGDLLGYNAKYRSRVAVVTSSGALTTWAVSGGVEGSNATVNSLALNTQNEVLIGGYFSKIGGQTRWMLGSVKSNGDLGSWYPTNGANGVVKSLVVHPPTKNIFVGGDFTSLSGQTRYRIGQVTSAGVLGSWYPSNGANIQVESLSLDATANFLFVGGRYSYIGGAWQNRISSLNVSTAAVNSSWYPTSGFGGLSVQSMAINKTTGTLYMGGDYSSLSGQTRKNLSAVTSSGVISSWYPANGVVGGVVNAVDVNQSTGEVYIAGNFTQVDGLNRFYAASITSGGVVTSWNPNPYTSGSVKAISVDQNSGNIYLGGSFNLFGGKPRSNFVIVKPSGDTQ